MHHTPTRLLAALGLSTALLTAPALAQEVTNVDVTLLLVNDIYSIDNRSDQGGFARLSAVVQAEREANDNVIYAVAGDFLSPSLLSSFDQGEHIVELFNMTPPDVIVPGNHEFDFGEEVFRARMAEVEGSNLLAANMRNEDGTVLDGFSDTMMMDVDGLMIGIIGLAADDSDEKSSPGTIQISSALETGLAQADALRDAGADIIVAVAHANIAVDNAMYATGEFDIILSGDDHDLRLMYDGRTALVESSEEAEYVTAIDVSATIEVEGDDRDVDYTLAFRPMSTLGMEGDAEVAARVDELNALLDAELDVALGTITAELDSRRATVRTQEATMGNLVADGMRAAVGADIAITNGGGIRADKVYDPGTEITRRDILTELPFGNVNIMIELSGAEVLAALENGFSRVEDVSGRFPQVSGMTIEADITREPGDRVTSVMVGGEPLDIGATYTVATNDFMGRGGDGYTMFAEAPRVVREEDAKLMANDVMVHVRELGEFAPAIDGRIMLTR
ncbi:MAG: 5'-nucleotidase C-terminal domain-containing protein [Rhizobiales bacterium]|nr:5'-nucleotidase C-terminal domain-containing protein [Hyphomicrobiales bacterium]MBO6700152.1 5'-nucleotidase C-terminal domain-containing protein [Hyphomicrobiales bacterium]MBO6737683.1 5'-nucleotidase C-terminal domain-containing protein [Hyphomicrobiales bacterium]MBO6913260.1 5'-nucleotidase C-terminal domain-containing protein [Hyphomicrobiales bacterium]MBO6954304.1 5'-nucleotidase C-terminal domain-containing protein [Hyphomicrobiales bacterium]